MTLPTLLLATLPTPRPVLFFVRREVQAIFSVFDKRNLNESEGRAS